MDGNCRYDFTGFGAMDDNFTYEFIGFGAIDGNLSYVRSHFGSSYEQLKPIVNRMDNSGVAIRGWPTLFGALTLIHCPCISSWSSAAWAVFPRLEVAKARDLVQLAAESKLGCIFPCRFK